jgi:hypothetical protein
MRWSVIALAVLLWATAGARATLVFFDDETEFLTAAPELALESFEGLEPTNIPDRDTVVVDDFVMSVTTGLDLAVCEGCTLGFATDGDIYIVHLSGAGESLTIEFDQPILWFGFNMTDYGDFGSGEMILTANNADGDSIVVAEGDQPENNLVFAGVASDTPFTQITLTNTVPGESYALDEFYYGVPAPSVLGLIALGLVFGRRRR